MIEVIFFPLSFIVIETTGVANALSQIPIIHGRPRLTMLTNCQFHEWRHKISL